MAKQVLGILSVKNSPKISWINGTEKNITFRLLTTQLVNLIKDGLNSKNILKKKELLRMMAMRDLEMKINLKKTKRMVKNQLKMRRM